MILTKTRKFDVKMMKSVKCVVCGDGEVGKTAFLITYTTDSFPDVYVPTVFDNFTQTITIDDVEVKNIQIEFK